VIKMSDKELGGGGFNKLKYVVQENNFLAYVVIY
jgi:hypothetical protein